MEEEDLMPDEVPSRDKRTPKDAEVPIGEEPDYHTADQTKNAALRRYHRPLIYQRSPLSIDTTPSSSPALLPEMQRVNTGTTTSDSSLTHWTADTPQVAPVSSEVPVSPISPLSAESLATASYMTGSKTLLSHEELTIAAFRRLLDEYEKRLHDEKRLSNDSQSINHTSEAATTLIAARQELNQETLLKRQMYPVLEPNISPETSRDPGGQFSRKGLYRAINNAADTKMGKISNRQIIEAVEGILPRVHNFNRLKMHNQSLSRKIYEAEEYIFSLQRDAGKEIHHLRTELRGAGEKLEHNRFTLARLQKALVKQDQSTDYSFREKTESEQLLEELEKMSRTHAEEREIWEEERKDLVSTLQEWGKDQHESQFRIKELEATERELQKRARKLEELEDKENRQRFELERFKKKYGEIKDVVDAGVQADHDVERAQSNDLDGRHSTQNRRSDAPLTPSEGIESCAELQDHRTEPQRENDRLEFELAKLKKEKRTLKHEIAVLKQGYGNGVQLLKESEGGLNNIIIAENRFASMQGDMEELEQENARLKTDLKTLSLVSPSEEEDEVIAKIQAYVESLEKDCRSLKSNRQKPKPSLFGSKSSATKDPSQRSPEAEVETNPDEFQEASLSPSPTKEGFTALRNKIASLKENFALAKAEIVRLRDQTTNGPVPYLSWIFSYIQDLEDKLHRARESSERSSDWAESLRTRLRAAERGSHGQGGVIAKLRTQLAQATTAAHRLASSKLALNKLKELVERRFAQAERELREFKDYKKWYGNGNWKGVDVRTQTRVSLSMVYTYLESLRASGLEPLWPTVVVLVLAFLAMSYSGLAVWDIHKERMVWAGANAYSPVHLGQNELAHRISG